MKSTQDTDYVSAQDAAEMDAEQLAEFRPSGIVHTPACLAEITATIAARKAYEEMWPNYCWSCDGDGGFTSSYDPSPSGVGLSPGCMYDFDICEDCSGKDLCPRCGSMLLGRSLEDTEPCIVCGYTVKQGGAPSLPDGPCACAEEAWAAWEQTMYDPFGGE